MVGGDLLGFLRKFKQVKRAELTIDSMLKSLLGVGEALHYLHCHHIVHRDVAARNILVGDSITDVRLSDFGLSRRMAEGKDYYKKINDERVPVKWMSLEAIRQKKFGATSDVWSFAVLIWEVLTFGESPWAALTPVETVLAIVEGQRMRQPKICSDTLYKLMLQCWELEPEDRPLMNKVCKSLSQISRQELPTTPIIPRRGVSEQQRLSESNLASLASGAYYSDLPENELQVKGEPVPNHTSPIPENGNYYVGAPMPSANQKYSNGVLVTKETQKISDDPLKSTQGPFYSSFSSSPRSSTTVTPVGSRKASASSSVQPVKESTTLLKVDPTSTATEKSSSVQPTLRRRPSDIGEKMITIV